MNLIFENHKKGNGGFISLKNESEEIGRLTYTIQPEKNTLIISYVMVFPVMWSKIVGVFHKNNS